MVAEGGSRRRKGLEREISGVEERERERDRERVAR